MEFENFDLPQLIVALDSKNEDANYVHIRDVHDDITYYCPCCGGEVKPRAYKNDKEYYVQPHFYHVSGACSDESRIHWLYKNWLFTENSKFYVNNTLYHVKEVFIELHHDTSYGAYIPDITVDTKENKRFFFEINFTNVKRDNDYFCKWSELNIDVVEVNVKELINKDYNNEIPTFNLIYSDYVCYKKEYIKRDLYASTIGIRKLEWKRQEKINYKMQWEKLDWFWLKLQDYKSNEIEFIDISKSFDQLNYLDKLVCFNILKKMKCFSNQKQYFIDNIIKSFDEYKDNVIDNYNRDNIKIEIEKEQYSSRIYYINITCINTFNNRKIVRNGELKINSVTGIVTNTNIDKIHNLINSLIDSSDNFVKLIKYINYYNDNKDNQYEIIYEETDCKILITFIINSYKYHKSINKYYSYDDMKNELDCFIETSLEQEEKRQNKLKLDQNIDNSIKMQDFIAYFNENYKDVSIKFTDTHIVFKHNTGFIIKMYYVDCNTNIDELVEKLYEEGLVFVKKFLYMYETILEYKKLLNNSKNQYWELHISTYNDCIKINVSFCYNHWRNKRYSENIKITNEEYDYNDNKNCYNVIISDDKFSFWLKNELFNRMKELYEKECKYYFRNNVLLVFDNMRG